MLSLITQRIINQCILGLAMWCLPLLIELYLVRTYLCFSPDRADVYSEPMMCAAVGSFTCSTFCPKILPCSPLLTPHTIPSLPWLHHTPLWTPLSSLALSALMPLATTFTLLHLSSRNLSHFIFSLLILVASGRVSQVWPQLWLRELPGLNNNKLQSCHSTRSPGFSHR